MVVDGNDTRAAAPAGARGAPGGDPRSPQAQHAPAAQLVQQSPRNEAASTAAPMLRDAAALLTRAAEAAEADEMKAASARARELAARAELEATVAAMRAKEASLAAELASEREVRCRLASELTSEREMRTQLDNELAILRAAPTGDNAGRQRPADNIARLVADNAKLLAQNRHLRGAFEKLRQKVKSKVTFHKALPDVAKSSPPPASAAVDDVAAAGRPGKRQRRSVAGMFSSQGNGGKAVEQRAVPGLRVYRLNRTIADCTLAAAAVPKPGGASDAEARSFPSKAVDDGEHSRNPKNFDVLETPAAPLAAVTGQRERLAADAEAGVVGQREVRAEGRVAAAAMGMPPLGAVPCRCVVRGKQERAALQGYDCEECRKFYSATGVAPKMDATGLQRGMTRFAPKSSRHRYEHAPTNTPPGFWDLSFPRGDQLGGQGAT